MGQIPVRVSPVPVPPPKRVTVIGICHFESGRGYQRAHGLTEKTLSSKEQIWIRIPVGLPVSLFAVHLLAQLCLPPVRLALFRRPGGDQPESNKLGNPPEPHLHQA
jgi:hypothetical protein